MENGVFNHQFLCRLLNIGANHAIIEGAAGTREVILYISDLLRYIYDSRKTVITLKEELDAADKYINIQKLKGNGSIELMLPFENSYDEIYIEHLSLLKKIVEDIDQVIETSENIVNLVYVPDFTKDRVIIKRQMDGLQDVLLDMKNLL